MKIHFTLIILFFVSICSAQDWQNGWESKNWQYQWDPNKSDLEVDTSAPDTMETAPVLAFTAPNQLEIDFTPSEIDSPDWSFIRLNLSSRDNSTTPLYIDIPKTTALADSNTVVTIVGLTYGLYTNDTTDVLYCTVSVYDSSGNSNSMAQVDEDALINFEQPIEIDSIYMNATIDTIFVRLLPSDRIGNDWIDSYLRVVSDLWCYRGSLDWNASWRSRLTLAEVEADSILKLATDDFTGGVQMGDTIRYDGYTFAYVDSPNVYLSNRNSPYANFDSQDTLYVVVPDTSDQEAPLACNITSVALGGGHYHLITNLTNSASTDVVGRQREIWFNSESQQTFFNFEDTTVSLDTQALAGYFYDPLNDTLNMRIRVYDEAYNLSPWDSFQVLPKDTCIKVQFDPVWDIANITHIQVRDSITEDLIRMTMSKVDTLTDTLIVKIDTSFMFDKDTAYFEVALEDYPDSTSLFGQSFQYPLPAGSSSAGTITFVGDSTGAIANDSDIDVFVPAGVSDGDILVMGILDDTDQGQTNLVSQGWTRQDSVSSSSSRLTVAYKIASSEPASYTITTAGGSQKSAIMLCYSKSAGTWAINESVNNSATGTSVSTSGVTFSQAGNFVVFFGNDDAVDVSTPPSGMTATESVSGSSSRIYGYREAIGSSGDQSATVEVGSSSDISIIGLSLEAQ